MFQDRSLPLFVPLQPRFFLFPSSSRRYPGDSWELLLGYEQEVAMARRAAGEVLARIRWVAGLGALVVCYEP